MISKSSDQSYRDLFWLSAFRLEKCNEQRDVDLPEIELRHRLCRLGSRHNKPGIQALFQQLEWAFSIW